MLSLICGAFNTCTNSYMLAPSVAAPGCWLGALPWGGHL